MFNKHRPDETIIFLSNPQHISDAWGPRRPKIRMSPPPHRTDNRGPRLSCPSTAAVSRSTPRQATVGRQRNVLVGPGAYSKPSHRWGLILRDWFFFVVFFFRISVCRDVGATWVRVSGRQAPDVPIAAGHPRLPHVGEGGEGHAAARGGWRTGSGREESWIHSGWCEFLFFFSLIIVAGDSRSLSVLERS